MSHKTLLFAVGALALAACASPTETKTVDAPAMIVRPPAPTALASRIAFSKSGDIYVMNTDGGGVAVRLTFAASNESDPAFSPDGSKIAFTSDASGKGDIYVMNGANGSGMVNLTNLTSYLTAALEPAWSPDGTKIAFTMVQDGNYDIYVMNADGSDTVRLTTHASVDRHPAWSPDGTKIAFTCRRYTGYREICVMDARNGDRWPLARLTSAFRTNGGETQHPAWSPDGSKVAFVALFPNQGSSLWFRSMRAEIGSPFYFVTTTASEPAWSPDGSQIAFTRHYGDAAGTGSDIYIVDATLDGSPVRFTNDGNDIAPSWAGGTVINR